MLILRQGRHYPTNTYAAKRHRLKGYAYDDQVKEINQAGV